MLLVNGKIATLNEANTSELIDAGSIEILGKRIGWLGKTADTPASVLQKEHEVIDCQGKLITPGLIDCHSHIVYGGDRAHEFALKLQGADYAEIARQGGGILSTVRATHDSDEDSLYRSAKARLEPMLAEGITTIEIKSGYGLDTDNELKMLRVAKRLGEDCDVRVQKTLLAAHALPPRFSGRSDDYISEICDLILPAAIDAGLVDAVDGFCESIGFSVEQIEKLFDCALGHNLPVKLHAEQLSRSGGAVMAAKKGAISVDHIEYINEQDAIIMAENNTLAVLLPGAFYTLHETQKPPIDLLRKHHVDFAIASDLNPGSSPINSLLRIMNMACVLFAVTPWEALAGVTINAAKALRLDDTIGSLAHGKSADLAIWHVDHPEVLSYHPRSNLLSGVMRNGRWRTPINKLAS